MQYWSVPSNLVRPTCLVYALWFQVLPPWWIKLSEGTGKVKLVWSLTMSVKVLKLPSAVQPSRLLNSLDSCAISFESAIVSLTCLRLNVIPQVPPLWAWPTQPKPRLLSSLRLHLKALVWSWLMAGGERWWHSSFSLLPSSFQLSKRVSLSCIRYLGEMMAF